ncbi:L,D-transpeptidase [Rubrivirga sp. IMCC45206]|uniref:L,D-transpeptidase n=1 Tax=Rubrivirga sp. IMCC45206 TaxID=3391614 RepID=UPI00398FD04A
MRFLTLTLLGVLAVGSAAAQTYDQSVLGAILERQARLPDTPVRYATYRIEHPSGNSLVARHALYEQIGEGDAALGRDRLTLGQLLGAPRIEDLRIGDRLVLPARPADFDLSPIAYAPYPRAWPGAAEIEKAVVVDKTTQTWAAYDRGRLARWGPASTGAAETPTPSGRFTMNWRTLERESSEAPPGERWLMRYVMNIHAARGIHLHQYDVVPTGPPQGHGCVRMVTADAQWLYAWSDGWQTTAGPGALGGRPTAPGTLVIVQGTEPDGPALRFVNGPGGPERVMVTLPPDPMAVPRGDR